MRITNEMIKREVIKRIMRDGVKIHRGYIHTPDIQDVYIDMREKMGLAVTYTSYMGLPRQRISQSREDKVYNMIAEHFGTKTF